MKIEKMADLIKSSDISIQTDNSYNFLLGKFGNNYKNRNSKEIELNNFLKGHKNMINLDIYTVEKLNLNSYPHVKENNFYVVFKNTEMKDKYIEICDNKDNKDKLYGELWGFPPNATEYYINRETLFRTPGTFEDLSVVISWADSNFVTSDSNLENDLIWMKKNKGSINGFCYIHKECSKFNVFIKDEKDNDWFFKKGQIYYTPISEKIYVDTIAVDIQKITF